MPSPADAERATATLETLTSDAAFRSDRLAQFLAAWTETEGTEALRAAIEAHEAAEPWEDEDLHLANSLLRVAEHVGFSGWEHEVVALRFRRIEETKARVEKLLDLPSIDVTGLMARVEPPADSDREWRDTLETLAGWLADGWWVSRERKAALNDMADNFPSIADYAVRKGISAYDAAKRYVLRLAIFQVLAESDRERRVRFGRGDYIKDADGRILELPLHELTLGEAREHFRARTLAVAQKDLDAHLRDTRPLDGEEEDSLARARSLNAPADDSEDGRPLAELVADDRATTLDSDRSGEEHVGFGALRALALERGLNLDETPARQRVVEVVLEVMAEVHGEDVSNAEVFRRASERLDGIAPNSVYRAVRRLEAD